MFNIKSSQLGVTLMELLIVISLMMVIVALVGPLTLNMVDKSKAQSEYIQLQNTLKRISYQAFASATKYQLKFNQQQVTVLKNQRQVAQSQFAYLRFVPQEIEFNSRGYPSPEQLKVELRNQQTPLNLFRLVEGTDGKIKE